MHKNVGRYDMDPIKSTAVVLCAALPLANASAQVNDDPFRTVVLRGDAAPGVATGSFTFIVRNAVRLNDLGQVGFYGIAKRAGDSFGSLDGLWRDQPLSGNDFTLTNLAVEGGNAPAFIEDKFTRFNGSFAGSRGFQLGNEGAAFWASFDEIDPNDANSVTRNNGFFRETGAGLEALAFAGKLVPGFDPDENVRFSSLPSDSIRINNNGTAAFTANISGANFASREALFVAGATGPEAIARVGTAIAVSGLDLGPAPSGTDPVFDNFRFPILNNAGNVAFGASLADEPFETNGVLVSYSSALDEFQALAREGQIISGEGTDSEVRIGNTGNFSDLLLNDNGSAMFRTDNLLVSDIDNPGVVAETGAALLTASANTGLSVLAKAGDQAAGIGSSARIGNITNSDSGLTFNNAGQVIFESTITGPTINNDNDRGFFITGVGEDIRTIIQEGDLAPGFEDRTDNDGNPVRIRSLDLARLNDFGEAVITVNTTFNGSDPAIYLMDSDLNLELITSEDFLFDVSDSGTPDLREIFTLLTDERNVQFNNLGQIAFYAQFDDSSDGVFITQALRASPIVPAPGGAIALVMGAGLVASRRRRKA